MGIFKRLFAAAAAFLRGVKNAEPTEAETVRKAMLLPRVRVIGEYPKPNYRKSGVAAAKRAARKTRNRKKGRKS